MIDLKPHFKYKVRGTDMFFWRHHQDGTPEFYHYQYYGPTRHIIYFWDKDLKSSEIEREERVLLNPKLSTENVTDAQFVHN